MYFRKNVQMKLFMILLGSKPIGRNTEQHDVFFGIGKTIKELVPAMIESWPEAKGKIHIDAWREVKTVNQFAIRISERQQLPIDANETGQKLFFINLGGYKENEFEEYHYKMLVAGENKSVAIKSAMETAFYKHTGFKGASTHVDDKYGVDIDDVYEIEDILPSKIKEKYKITLMPVGNGVEDELNIGYFKLDKL
jgi:hypothetical protein